MEKILFISHELTYTGAPLSLLGLVKTCRKLGCEVTVWSLKDGDFLKEFQKEIIPVYIVDNCLERLKKEKHQFSLIILNTIFCAYIANKVQDEIYTILIIREAANLPELIKTFHINEKDFLSIRNIVCISEYACEYIRNRYFKIKIDIIHNYIENDKPAGVNIAHNGIVRFLFSGTIEYRKGLDLLITAFHNLPQNIKKKCELNIVGRIPAWGENYWKCIKTNDENIIYHGEIHDRQSLLDLYKRMNVFVVPSRDEACSRVVLEAAMLGKGIIISDHVGASYILGKKCGISFKKDNAEDLCLALIRYTNRIKLILDGIYLRKQYMQTSTEKQFIKQITNYYFKHINKGDTTEGDVMNELSFVYITDENYVMPTEVSILSLIYHKSRKVIYQVYILAIDLQLEHKHKLTNLQTPDTKINIIDICQTKEYQQLEIKNFHVSTAALYKFMLPNLFETKDEILYLDCDTLILGDITEIFQYDIKEYYAAVVKDYKAATYHPTQLQKLGINSQHRFYFNSGMMYLNLKKMRENDITSRLMNYRKNGINYFMDQDALNVIFADNVIYLPFKYNFMYRIFDIFSKAECYSFYDLDYNKDIMQHLDDSVILHLTSENKPWEHYVPVLSDIFLFYYQKTSYKYLNLPILNNDPIKNVHSIVGKDIIPIVYVCENKSVMNMAASLSSLILNKYDTTVYEIFIYCCNLSIKNMNLLKLYIKKYDRITLIIVNEYDYYNEYDYLNNMISISTLAKFSLPQRLNQFHKAIYLGNNTLILRDLTDLFSQDISGKYFGAVKDYNAEISKPTFNKKLFTNHEYYFGTDMLLLNLEYMRLSKISDELLYYKKYGINFYSEQDAYNVCAKENVAYLSLYFNYMTHLNLLAPPEEIYNFYNIKKYTSYEELLSRAYIINFSTKNKPWNEKIYLETELYFYYLWRTPYYAQFQVSEKMLEIKNLLNNSIKDKNILSGLIKESFRLMPFNIKKNLCPLENPILEDFHTLQTDVTDQNILPSIPLEISNKREKKIIVSLTTIPQRIEAAAKVIEGMLTQSIRPDIILLNLGIELFKDIELPQKIKDLKNNGIQIRYCQDLGCHTKYYYAMKQFPNDIIITIDDDIIYSNTLIENLYHSYLQFPKAISAMRVHCITFDINNNMLAPYKKWHTDCSEYIGIPSMKLFATGVGGVLYPPHCMDNQLFDDLIFRKLAPKQDDIWLKFMQLLSTTPCVLAKRQAPLEFIGDTQDIGLCYSNVQGGQNDLCIEELLDFFDREEILDRLTKHDEIPIIYYNNHYDTRTEALRQTIKLAEKVAEEKLQIEDLQNKLSLCQFHLEETKKSKSYQWGRIITYLPRLIRHLLFKHTM